MSSSDLYADTLSWKAEIIDPSTVEGIKRFSELKLDGSIRTISDTLENQVAELLMENKVNKEINFPKIDNLAFKTFLQKYNSTYSKNLLSEQKELLGKYITSFADNGLPFKIFLNEEIDRLKTNLTEKIKQTPQNNLNEQLKEVLTVVDGFKKQKIDKKLVEKVLKIQNLMGEI